MKIKKRFKANGYKKTNAFRCGCCANGDYDPKAKSYKSAVRFAMKQETRQMLHEMDEPDYDNVPYHSMDDWSRYTGEFDKFAAIPMEERTYRGRGYHPNYEKWYYSFPLSEEFRLP